MRRFGLPSMVSHNATASLVLVLREKSAFWIPRTAKTMERNMGRLGRHREKECPVSSVKP